MEELLRRIRHERNSAELALTTCWWPVPWLSSLVTGSRWLQTYSAVVVDS